MMEIVADTHTHTVACDHALSTLEENIASAREKGLRMLAVTEHTPDLPGAPERKFFLDLLERPRFWGDLMLLKGAECNITDFAGTLDLDEDLLEKLDWVIASMHIPCLEPGSRAQHTKAWLAVAENPRVDVMGHMGDGRYEFDHDRVLRAVKERGKIVEINAHSLFARPGSVKNCPEIALLCKKYRIPVVVSSDAHKASSVGRVGASLDLLEQLAFPKELILNLDYDRFLEAARKASGRTLTDD